MGQKEEWRLVVLVGFCSATSQYGKRHILVDASLCLNKMTQDEEDGLMALQLQAQFYEEEMYHRSLQDWTVPQETEGSLRPRVTHSMRRDLSIVDPFWELNDPIPDIRCLFREFDMAYFWNKLGSVEVKWSPRMTRCAGVCSYEGKGGLISVRLSEPLLKLRPRKDLVETLLHEMIHAYLFVTRNFRDHSAHGEEFHEHMRRINTATGANITVYHNFHDEVKSYRVHWWRCTGPCRDRKPYYGMVKRAINRPPSARDVWWDDHQRTCGGTFLKIREPEPKAKRKRIGKNSISTDSKKFKIGQQDILPLLTPLQKVAGPSVEAGRIRPSLAEESHHKPSKLANIHCLSGALHKPGQSQDRAMTPFSGRGNVLGGSSFPSHSGSSEPEQGRAPWVSVSAQSTWSKQPTLADFLKGPNKKQATSPDLSGSQSGSPSSSSRVGSRRHRPSVMKIMHELLTSESEDEGSAEKDVAEFQSGAKAKGKMTSSALTKSRDDDWLPMLQGVVHGAGLNSPLSHYGLSKPVAIASIFRGQRVYDGSIPSTSREKSWEDSHACLGTAGASCLGSDEDNMWVDDSPSKTGQWGDYKKQLPVVGTGLQQCRNETAAGLQGACYIPKSSGNCGGGKGECVDMEVLSQEPLRGQDEPMMYENSTLDERQGQSTSLIVNCPVCGLEVPERLINQHLDLDCVLEV